MHLHSWILRGCLALVLGQVSPFAATPVPAAPPAPSQTNSTSFEDMRAAADKGDSIAQCEIGKMFDLAREAPKDNQQAILWFGKAAAAGNAEAQHALGWMFYDTQGMTKKLGEAAAWFRKSADLGYAPAQYDLAWMYLAGEGVAKSVSFAAEWMQKSAQQGETRAQYTYGLMCARGAGVNTNFIEARKWLNLAATNGDQAAAKVSEMVLLRMTLKTVTRYRMRPSAARPAPSMGAEGLLRSLAMNRLSSGEGMTAGQYWTLDPEARASMVPITSTFYPQVTFPPLKRIPSGREIRRKKVELDQRVLAMQLRQAQDGIPEAQYEVGKRFLKGDGVEKSEAKAAGWLEKAANQNNREAVALLKSIAQGKPTARAASQ